MTDNDDALKDWEYELLSSQYEKDQITIRELTEERDMLRTHSIALNKVLYEIGIALGMQRPGEDFVSTPDEILHAVLDRIYDTEA